MDGNFIDNDFDNIISSAALTPEDYTYVADKNSPSPLKKYDKFALRIKFNRDLDPHSINSGSAVILSGNKRVKTSVEYDNKRRSIIISPKSDYLRNTLYFLKLSGRVMTESGRSLRENRYFVFKQDGKTLSFYKNPEAAAAQRAPDKIYARQGMVLPLFFAASAMIIVFSYFYAYRLGITLGAALVILATIAAAIDSVSEFGKSGREYTYGAKLYNDGFFYEAVECFELALHYNPENIYAQAGLDAAIVKLSETGG